MGKRKFRLKTIKHYERKKYAKLQRESPLSTLPHPAIIPKSNCDVATEPTKLLKPADVKPSSLIIQIPISIYTASPVCDASHLQKRLMSCASLPEGWTWSLLISDLHPPVFSLTYNLPCNGSQVAVTLVVKQNCQWLLHLNSSEVDLSFCQLLKRYLSSPLNCIDLLHFLMSCLQKSNICLGNPDEKFLPVQQRHSGTFSGKSGRLFVVKLFKN